MKIPKGWPTGNMCLAFEDASGVKLSIEEFDEGLRAALEAAPTPPAQEAEPVAIVDHRGVGGIMWTTLYMPKEGAKLYTHAPSDKLQQAARELVSTFDRIKCLESRYGPCPVVENLRAVLEGKS